MKVLIVLAAFVCYAAAQTPAPVDVKKEVLDRAAKLETQVKEEIAKLKAEGKEHLSVLLQEEETRLEALVANLTKATSVIEVTILESLLIEAEYRVENEVNNLQRETATLDFLEQNVATLDKWVKQEIATLNATTGADRQRALEVAQLLQREETRLDQIAQRLLSAQNQREIEALEVELRALEIRVAEALNALHFFDGSTPAPPVSTATPPASTGTPRVTTGAPVTTGTSGTTRTSAPTGTTPGSAKQELIDRATQLEAQVKDEIAKLTAEKREHLATVLREEETRLETLVTQLKAATDAVQLATLEANLIDAEFRVENEVAALQRDSLNQDVLLENAKALQTRLTAEIAKLDAVTGPDRQRAQQVEQQLKVEEQSLVQITQRLIAAQDQRTIETLEVQIRALEIRIAQALKQLNG